MIGVRFCCRSEFSKSENDKLEEAIELEETSVEDVLSESKKSKSVVLKCSISRLVKLKFDKHRRNTEAIDVQKS